MRDKKGKILLNVTYKIQDRLRDEFIRQVLKARIPEDTRLEAGNEKYSWSIPVDREDEVGLLEFWENEETQKAHLNTENYKKLSELKEKYVLSVEIEKFIVE